jgi:hypothetical protein
VHTNDALNLRCTKMPDWADRARWRGRILSQIRSPRRRGCPCRKKKPVGCRDGNRVILRLMLDFLRLLLGLMADLFRSRASLEAEELALRQRSTCCSARGRSDRHSRRWTGWCSVGFVGGSRTLATRSRSSDLRRSCAGIAQASSVLALEVAAPAGASRSVDRDPAIDPRVQHRQSALGRASSPRRTAQAWNRHWPDQRRQVYGAAEGTLRQRVGRHSCATMRTGLLRSTCSWCRRSRSGCSTGC